MKKIAIIYGSSGGNAEDAAKRIAGELKENDVKLFDVANVKSELFDEYPNLILGTSTTGIGDLQDDWDRFLPKFKKLNLEGKTVALFGLGDSDSYSDSFVDSMGILFETVSEMGANVIGSVSTDDYTFDSSRAVVDGAFVGLALDEDNEPEKTVARIQAWTAELLVQFV